MGLRSLHIRYQMAENVTTLRFLVPITISFGTLFAAAFAIILYMTSLVVRHDSLTVLVQQLFVYEQVKFYNLITTSNSYLSYKIISSSFK